MYKNSSAIRIEAVGNNALMVYAGLEDHFEIARLVKGAVVPSSATELLPLTNLEADKVASTLKNMFQDSKTGSGPYIEADTNRNAIIVKGTPEQVADVKVTLKAIGDAEGSANVRVITLDRGGATAFAAELERLMNQMRRNPVKVIAPNPDKIPEPAPAPKNPGGNGGGADQPQLADPRAQKPGTNLPVTITVIGNKLIVTSEDPQALQLANEVARLLMQSPAGDGDFEIIRLKNAVASDASAPPSEATRSRVRASASTCAGLASPSSPWVPPSVAWAACWSASSRAPSASSTSASSSGCCGWPSW
jgi:hypothetical protein